MSDPYRRTVLVKKERGKEQFSGMLKVFSADAGFEVLTAVAVSIFWNITPCSKLS
jgi:hypothetical protein